MKTTTKKQARWVIVANERYGLYFGRTSATDKEVAATKSVRCTDCRHIARYHSLPGGITSLASYGPDIAKENRVGAPCAALLTGVVNVFDVSPAAVKRFAAVEPSR
jgi:hypothetical protein